MLSYHIRRIVLIEAIHNRLVEFDPQCLYTIPIDHTYIMDTLTIRQYTPDDYPELAALYKETEKFDPETDAEWKINRKSQRDPESLLIAMDGEKMVGSVSLLEDGRVAWFFRLVAVGEHKDEVIKVLVRAGAKILKEREYSEALVYSLTTDSEKRELYKSIGFNEGKFYHCLWVAIDLLFADI